jgi:hypothetical protein
LQTPLMSSMLHCTDGGVLLEGAILAVRSTE